MKEKSIHCDIFSFEIPESECQKLLKESLKKGLLGDDCETCNNNPTAAESLTQEANETHRKRTPSFVEPVSKKEMSEESKTLFSFIAKRFKDDFDNKRELSHYLALLCGIGQKNGNIFRIMQILDDMRELKDMERWADEYLEENLSRLEGFFNSPGPGPVKSAIKLIVNCMPLIPTNLTNPTINAINEEILDIKKRLGCLMEYYPQTLERERKTFHAKPEEIKAVKNRASVLLKKRTKELVTEIVSTGFSENKAFILTLHLLCLRFPEDYSWSKSGQNTIRYAYLSS